MAGNLNFFINFWSNFGMLWSASHYGLSYQREVCLSPNLTYLEVLGAEIVQKLRREIWIFDQFWVKFWSAPKFGLWYARIMCWAFFKTTLPHVLPKYVRKFKFLTCFFGSDSIRALLLLRHLVALCDHTYQMFLTYVRLCK